MDSLKGEVAIIAGGSSGFGRHIATRFASLQAAVTLVARGATRLAEAAADIRRDGGEVHTVAADLTRPAEVARVVDSTTKRFGTPTICVFAAAVPGPFGPLWMTDSDEWWEAITLHIRGPALLLRHVVPTMIAARKGRVLLITSPAGNGNHPYMSPYCLGKASQIRLAALVDHETRQHGVRVFAVDPGLAFTPMAQKTVDDPVAVQYLPQLVERLSLLMNDDEANEAVLDACAACCVTLALGSRDSWGGRFVRSEIAAGSTTSVDNPPVGSPHSRW